NERQPPKSEQPLHVESPSASCSPNHDRNRTHGGQRIAWPCGSMRGIGDLFRRCETKLGGPRLVPGRVPLVATIGGLRKKSSFFALAAASGNLPRTSPGPPNAF